MTGSESDRQEQHQPSPEETEHTRSGDLYDAYYYASSCGRPYQRDAEWLKFFGRIAEHIVREIGPRTVLDAGCALGFLVEELRRRDVEAYGVDISEFAIQNAHSSIQPYVWNGSVTDPSFSGAPFPERFDLIVSIEVLEHMPKADAELAVENFCRHTDQVLFSSTPFDYKEATHFNVQPPEYWAELFARHGFYREVDFDASVITSWAALYRRRDITTTRLVREYERKFSLLWKENVDLRQLAVEARDEIARNEAAIRSLTAERDTAQEQYQTLRGQSDAKDSAVRAMLAELSARRRLSRNPLVRPFQAAGRWLRDLGDTVLRRVYRPSLVPLHEVAAQRGAETQDVASLPEVWKSTGRSPQFLIGGPLPYGLAHVILRGASTPGGHVNFVVERGGGVEHLSLGNFTRRASNLHAYLTLGRDFGAVRLEVSAGPGTIQLDDIFIRRVTRLEIGLYFLREWVQREGRGAKSLRHLNRALRGVLQRSGPRGVWHWILSESYAKDPDVQYEEWLVKNEVTPERRAKLQSRVEALAYRPRISILMPVYNTDERWLRAAIDSVLGQVYPDWELCIADDASTEPHVHRVLDEYAGRDRRVRVAFREQNGHISAASNTALELATGEFVATLDHDDVLTPDALYEVVALLNAHPEADMVYSDEDKIGEDGHRRYPYFKPDWSPDLFLSQMYTAHLAVYRTELMRRIGGYRLGLEGAQDYDLVLRLTEQTNRIHHIPTVLYSWRQAQGSTARHSSAKDYAYLAAQRALQEALDRRGRQAQIAPVSGFPGHWLVQNELQRQEGENPLVSIIICTKDKARLLGQCLDSIFTRTDLPNFEVIVIDNRSEQAETFRLFETWQKKEPQRFRVQREDYPFNYSRLNNAGARLARGEMVLFLNNDIEVITPGWLREMAGQAQREEIGAVGAMLLYPDETIQHAGIVLGIGGWAGHSHKFVPASSPGYAGRLLGPSNYAAVTGACLMMRRSLFFELGGFDEELAVACSDVELCLHALDTGHYNVVLPQVRLFHYESASRGYEDTPEKQERFRREIARVRQLWPAYMENDPFYNPNLTCDREDFSLG